MVALRQIYETVKLLFRAVSVAVMSMSQPQGSPHCVVSFL